MLNSFGRCTNYSNQIYDYMKTLTIKNVFLLTIIATTLFSCSDKEETDNENLISLEKPQIIYPENGDSDLPTSLTLTWTNIGDNVKYVVYMDDEPTDLDKISNVYEGSNATEMPMSLEPNTTYYWSVGASEDGNRSNSQTYSFTTKSASTSKGTTYGNFGVTDETFDKNGDWNQIVESVFGSDYKVADWNDLTAYYNSNNSIENLLDGLGLEKDNSVAVTYNGNKKKSSTRWYFITRHNHAKPGYYLAHKNIDNYLLSLGSWDGNRRILAIRK
jgi:hypothetical protein